MSEWPSLPRRMAYFGQHRDVGTGPGQYRDVDIWSVNLLPRFSKFRFKLPLLPPHTVIPFGITSEPRAEQGGPAMLAGASFLAQPGQAPWGVPRMELEI